MSEERHAKVIYDIEYDERKARETQRVISDTRKGTRAVKEEAALADRVLDRLGSQTGTLGDYMGESARGARELADELRKVEEQARDAGNAVETVGSGRGPGSGGGLGGRGAGLEIVGRADTAASALAGLAGAMGIAESEALMFTADILGSAEAVTLLSREVTGATGGVSALGAAIASPTGLMVAGAAAAAVALLGVALSDFITGMQGQTRELNAAFAASRTIAEAVSEGMTTEEAEARVAELQRLISLEEGELAKAEAAYGRLAQGVIDLFPGMDAASLGIKNAIFGVQQAFDTREEAIYQTAEEARTNLEKYRHEHEQFSAAVESGAFAVNDAAGAQAALAAETIASIDAAAQVEMQRAGLLRTATVTGVEASIAATEDQIGAYARQVEALRASSDGSDAYVQAIAGAEAALAQAEDQMQFLETAALAQARANEAAAQAAEEAKRAEEALARAREADQRIYERAVDAYVAYQDSLGEVKAGYAQGMIDAEAQYHDAIARQNADFHAAQIGLAREAADEAAKLTSDRARVEADADEELRKGAEQFHKEMAQLQKRRHLQEYLDQLDHDASLRELALRRDVSGFIAEEAAFDRDRYRQDAEERLDDEERRMQFEDAQRAIEDRRLRQLAANDQALADLQARISQENAALEVANEAKLAEIEDALDEEKAQLKQAAIDQATARETAYEAQLADLNRSLSSETELRAQYYAEWSRQAEASFREFQGLMDQARAQTEMTMAEPLPTGKYSGSTRTAESGASVTVNAQVGETATLSQVQDLARQTQRAVQTQAKRWQMLRNRL